MLTKMQDSWSLREAQEKLEKWPEKYLPLFKPKQEDSNQREKKWVTSSEISILLEIYYSLFAADQDRIIVSF